MGIFTMPILSIFEDKIQKMPAPKQKGKFNMLEKMPPWTLAHIPCLGFLIFDWNNCKFSWDQTSNRSKKNGPPHQQASQEINRKKES